MAEASTQDPVPTAEGSTRIRRRKSKANRAPEEHEDAEAAQARAATPQELDATPQDAANVEATAEQQKERKKPRKLERRSVRLEEPMETLETKVERLERQFQNLNSRVDAVEIRQTRRRRPVIHTQRRASSTSTRATSTAAMKHGVGAGPRARIGPASTRPSLAEQLRESQRLQKTTTRPRNKGPEDAESIIEEIPRTELATTTGQRQVALTGQYNIPLPSGLTAEDILNLKSGITAAGSIARSLASALAGPHRAQGHQRNQSSGSGNAATADAGQQRQARRPRGGVRYPQEAGAPARSPKVSVLTVQQQGNDGDDGISKSHDGNDGKTTSSSAGPEEVDGGEVTSGGGASGYRAPGGGTNIDENAAKAEKSGENTWTALLGRAVASAAKDAAVEIQDASNTNNRPGTANSNRSTGQRKSASHTKSASRTKIRRDGGAAAAASTSGVQPEETGMSASDAAGVESLSTQSRAARHSRASSRAA